MEGPGNAGPVGVETGRGGKTGRGGGSRKPATDRKTPAAAADKEV